MTAAMPTKRLCMLCWLHQSELRGGWSASSSRSPGTYQWNLHPAVCHAPPAALPPIPFLRMMLTGAGSSRRGAQLTPKECERRWRSAVRELRKAVEADHAYAEEVPPQHPLSMAAHHCSDWMSPGFGAPRSCMNAANIQGCSLRRRRHKRVKPSAWQPPSCDAQEQRRTLCSTTSRGSSQCARGRLRPERWRVSTLRSCRDP